VIALAALVLFALLALGYALFSPRTTTTPAPIPQSNIAPNDWPAYMYDMARSGFNSQEMRLSPDNASGLHLQWKQPLGKSMPLAAQPVVFSNTLYMGSWDGQLYALNTQDGSTRWTKDLGTTTSKLCSPQTAGITSAPQVTNNALYIGGGDDKLYALNPQTGDTLWTFKTGDNSEAGGLYNWVSPILYNDRVYYGIASFCDNPFVNGRMWGLNAQTGAVEQEVHFVPDDQLGGGIWTSPTIDAATGDVFVTTGSGYYYIPYSYSMVRLDPNTLQVADYWQIPLANQVFDGDWGTTPTLFKDKDGRQLVGASAKDGYYYVFDAKNIHAGPVWKAQIADGGSCPQCGEGAISSSAYAYNTVYVAAGYISLGQTQKFPGTVTALDPTTGEIKWQHPTSGWVIPAVAVANGLVFAAAQDTVEVLNASTGALVWEYSTEGVIYSAPIVAGGILYVASTDGNIYAFTAGPYPDNPTAYSVTTVGAHPPQFTPFRTPVPAQPLDGDKQCFDDTGKCARGAFLAFWNANGGLDRFGPAVTDELNEAGRTVQYFRNAYFQMYTQPDGTLGVRLGPLDYRLFYYTPKDDHFESAEPISGTTYVPETSHNLPEPFLSYWRTHGEVASLGYPVSEPLTEFDIVDKQTKRVQYFERSRLEISTGPDGTQHVEIGTLGLLHYLQRYGKLP
jgi:polyvinyl alcohol dehydrogenase (cytochrome)